MESDAALPSAPAPRAAPAKPGPPDRKQKRKRQKDKMREKVGEELMEAVRAGDAATVSKVCANGDADATYADEFGFSCLHLAAKRGNDDVVRECMWGGICVRWVRTWVAGVGVRSVDRHAFMHAPMHTRILTRMHTKTRTYIHAHIH